MNRYFWLVLVVALLSGCGSGDERGIKDSRKEFMSELQQSLDDKGIPYTVDDEGYIKFSSEYEDDVKKIKDSIDARRLSEVGTKYEDKSSTDYFRQLLGERGIQYRTETRKDGEWTYWHPESKEQQDELEMKVVSHALDEQAERSESK